MIFLTLTFLPKIKFSDFRNSKMTILTVLEALNFNFGDFLQFLMVELYQKTKFRAPKSVEMAVLNSSHSWNWFHVKCEWKKNS